LIIAVEPWQPVVQENIILQKESDAQNYHVLAYNLVNYHEFAIYPGIPYGLRTPLYPLYIAVFYCFFGAAPWVPILFQVLLDSFSCVIVFQIIERFAVKQVAFCASLFYALDPFLIFSSTALLSETLFIFLLLIGTLFFAKAIENISKKESSKFKSISLAGCFFGLATLVRPISLYLLLVIPIFLLFVLRRHVRLAITLASLFATAFFLCILPWGLRNVNSFGTPSLSSSGAYNLLILYVSPFEAARRGQPIKVVQESLVREADSIMVHDGFIPSQLDEFQRTEYWKDLAINYIRRNPLGFFKHFMIGIAHSFVNIGSRDYAVILRLPHGEEVVDVVGKDDQLQLLYLRVQLAKHKSAYEMAIALAFAAWLLVQYGCLIIGICVSWKSTNNIFLAFCLMMATYFILLAGPSGYPRFRLPAIPFYLVFVGVGGMFLYSMIRYKLRK